MMTIDPNLSHVKRLSYDLCHFHQTTPHTVRINPHQLSRSPSDLTMRLGLSRSGFGMQAPKQTGLAESKSAANQSVNGGNWLFRAVCGIRVKEMGGFVGGN